LPGPEQSGPKPIKACDAEGPIGSLNVTFISSHLNLPAT
jgi:hypothetical protein